MHDPKNALVMITLRRGKSFGERQGPAFSISDFLRIKQSNRRLAN